MTGADLRRSQQVTKQNTELEKSFKADASLNYMAEVDPHPIDARVIHAQLGPGRILGYAGKPSDRRVVIIFDQGGQRELLLAFCNGKLMREATA
jgi:hypothetical protein